MPIDREKATALEFAPLTVDVERGRLRLFAKVMGETNPVYTDVDAARADGHPDLPVPPTYFFSLGLEAPDPFDYLDELGVDLRFVLHGEQSFTYHRMAYGGDRLTLQDRIVDVYAKRNGELEFIVKQANTIRERQPIAEMRSIIVVRNPGVGK